MAQQVDEFASGPAIDSTIDRSRPYPSCEWLEGGIAFNRRSIHACLIVHHGRGFPKLCDFDGGDVPWDLVEQGRRRIIRQNQRGGHPDCAGCPHLVERLWPKPRYGVHLVGIAQFVRCNIFCNYCFLQTQDPESFKDGLDPYEVAPAIDGLIRDGRLAPDATFDWGGGEPTIYREFDALLRRVSELGGTTWVHTNGTRFPKPLAGGLDGSGVGVICSVDAGFPQTYLKMKGRDYFERVWLNLRKFVDAGCHVHLKYIVKDENSSAGELAAFIDRAAALEAEQLIVDLDYDFPNPSREVLDAMVMLRTLANERGIATTFGATGAQMLPEFDEATRVWTDSERQIGPLQKRQIFRHRGRGGIAELDVLPPGFPDSHTVEEPSEVFVRLEGLTFVEIPAEYDSLTEDFWVSTGLDRSDWSPPSARTEARFVVHRSSTATLLVICGSPGFDTAARLRMLADGLARATACTPIAWGAGGEGALAGRPDSGPRWRVFASRGALMTVLCEDEPFAEGLALTVLRQLDGGWVKRPAESQAPR